MLEKRVFNKSGLIQFIEVNTHSYNFGICEFITETSIRAREIHENSLILVDFDDSRMDNNLEKKCYHVYLSSTRNINDVVLYLHKDVINDCTRIYVDKHLETALFGDTVKLNEFLAEHSELNFENTKIQPFGNDLLLTYVNIGDEGKPWVE